MEKVPTPPRGTAGGQGVAFLQGKLKMPSVIPGMGGRRPFTTQMAPAVACLYVDAGVRRPDRCPRPETQERPGADVASPLGRTILLVEVSLKIGEILFPRRLPARPGDDTVLAGKGVTVIPTGVFRLQPVALHGAEMSEPF